MQMPGVSSWQISITTAASRQQHNLVATKTVLTAVRLHKDGSSKLPLDGRAKMSAENWPQNPANADVSTAI
jgi:hypothetical protein